MPVLPVIDLLLLLGWTTIAAGGVLKAIYLTTSYRPTAFGLAPGDLMLVACAFLLLALTLAARTWVRLNEPRLHANHRANSSLESYNAAMNGAYAAREAHREERAGGAEPAPHAAQRSYGS